MKVLIDGDSLVYTIGFATQKNIHQVIDEEGTVFYENEIKNMALGFIEDNPGLGELDITHRIEVSPDNHAFHSLKMIIQKISQRARANSYKIYLTGKGNFREGIATIMGYKHNRLNKPKPILYDKIRAYLQSTHKATMITGMEADDALSIVYARSISGVPTNVSIDPDHEVLKYPEETIIAAIDKDLRNIPGNHINFDKRVAENDEYKFITVTEEDGRLGFWKQVLTGDSSDNILGIPRMGPKKADAVLEGCMGEIDYFWAVYAAYKKYYGIEPFEYYRYDAYEDTTATFTKRKLKDRSKIKAEQILQGTALIMLLENARLLWMLRVPPNAEGTHWWMPPVSFEDIALKDAEENTPPAPTEPDEPPASSEKPANGEYKEGIDYEKDTPFSEGRGKWFYITEMSGHPIKVGPFGTKKKAEADIKKTDEKDELITEEQGSLELVTEDDLVTEPIDNSADSTSTWSQNSAPYWDEAF